MTQGPKLQREHSFPKINTVGKFSTPVLVTGKQNDWDENCCHAGVESNYIKA